MNQVMMMRFTGRQTAWHMNWIRQDKPGVYGHIKRAVCWRMFTHTMISATTEQTADARRKVLLRLTMTNRILSANITDICIRRKAMTGKNTVCGMQCAMQVCWMRLPGRRISQEVLDGVCLIIIHIKILAVATVSVITV